MKGVPRTLHVGEGGESLAGWLGEERWRDERRALVARRTRPT